MGRLLRRIAMHTKNTESFFGDAEWTENPWFAGPNGLKRLRPFGVSQALVRKATLGLSKIYPPSVCRQMDRPGAAAIVSGLFSPEAPLPMVRLLHLGRDIVDARAWESESLCTNLTNEHEFMGAEFELRTLANLRRAGVRVQRLEGRQSDKTPDFRLMKQGFEFTLECKRLRESESVQLEQEWALPVGGGWRISELAIEGCVVELIPSAAYAALIDTERGRAKLEDERDSIHEAFATARRALKLGERPETVEVPPYGQMRIRQAPEAGLGMVVPNFLVPTEKDDSRACRLVEKAVRQTNAVPNTHGIIAVDVGRQSRPQSFFDELRSRVQTKAALFEQVAMVIFIFATTNDRGDLVYVPHGYDLSRAPPAGLMESLSLTIGSHTRPTPFPMQAADWPDRCVVENRARGVRPQR